MNFMKYQCEARRTAFFTEDACEFAYCALGLNGEAGEVAEEIKKSIRDDFGDITPDRRKRIELELGDVLWYVAMLADQLDLSLDRIAKKNLKKLEARHAS